MQCADEGKYPYMAHYFLVKNRGTPSIMLSYAPRLPAFRVEKRAEMSCVMDTNLLIF